MELFTLISVLIVLYLLWRKTQDSKISKNYKNIINVLDRLHDFAVRDLKHKNFDFGLYKILNSEEVYQEAIHMGIYPVVGENKEASPEFMRFVNNLWMYIEYDVNATYLWAMTSPGLEPDKEKQKNIHEKISQTRKEILQYLLDKKLISNEIYTNELNYKVKSLMD